MSAKSIEKELESLLLEQQNAAKEVKATKPKNIRSFGDLSIIKEYAPAYYLARQKLSEINKKVNRYKKKYGGLT